MLGFQSLSTEKSLSFRWKQLYKTVRVDQNCKVLGQTDNQWAKSRCNVLESWGELQMSYFSLGSSLRVTHESFDLVLKILIIAASMSHTTSCNVLMEHVFNRCPLVIMILTKNTINLMWQCDDKLVSLWKHDQLQYFQLLFKRCRIYCQVLHSPWRLRWPNILSLFLTSPLLLQVVSCMPSAERSSVSAVWWH